MKGEKLWTYITKKTYNFFYADQYLHEAKIIKIILFCIICLKHFCKKTMIFMAETYASVRAESIEKKLSSKKVDVS